MINLERYKQALQKSGLKKSALCKALGVTYMGLNRKEKGLTEFKAKEITKLCKLLNLSLKDKEAIFFA